MNADRLTRWTAFAAVLAVAAVAAWISYRHAVEIVTAHGETGAVGRLYPVVIDGLIVAASMVLLDAARHREAAPRLAWWLLASGIGATLAANVLAGVPSGWLGAIVAAWPAAAFVGCYELLMMLVRASARRAGAEPAEAQIRQVLTNLEAAPGAVSAVPGMHLNGSGLHPAEVQPFADELARGELPTIRRIRSELHVGQPKAQEIRARLSALARSE